MLSLTLTSATNRIRLVQLSLFMFFALFVGLSSVSNRFFKSGKRETFTKIPFLSGKETSQMTLN